MFEAQKVCKPPTPKKWNIHICLQLNAVAISCKNALDISTYTAYPRSLVHFYIGIKLCKLDKTSWTLCTPWGDHTQAVLYAELLWAGPR